MKSKAITCAIAALSLSVSGVVFAQSDRDDHRGDNHGRPAHADARQAPDEGRGAGPDHNFRRNTATTSTWSMTGVATT